MCPNKIKFSKLLKNLNKNLLGKKIKNLIKQIVLSKHLIKLATKIKRIKLQSHWKILIRNSKSFING